MEELDERLQRDLYDAHSNFLAACDKTPAELQAFLELWTVLTERLRSAIAANAVSDETLTIAQKVTVPISKIAASLLRLNEEAQRGAESLTSASKAIIAEGMDYRDSDDEDNDYSDNEDELPDANWESLRDWFLAHLAHPYPTPSQCRRLVKESHIDGEELDSWFERMRELTHWDELFSTWAQGDLNLMKQLVKLAQKEVDLEIPDHRCRTTAIQRSELEQLKRLINEVYKPGPSEWWADIEALLDESDGGEDGYSEDDNMGPPSDDDDDDAQELAVLDPDCGIDTFFDTAERSACASICPSMSSPISTQIPFASKGFPAPPPISALQREGLDWLDKLEQVEAEADAAYAEVERIASTLEDGGDEALTVKLEAAEARFEKARVKETELATAALRRVPALQAQVMRERATGQKFEPVFKQEYVEEAILHEVNHEPAIKSEVFEEAAVPLAKAEVKVEPDPLDSKVFLAKVQTGASIGTTTEPLVKNEPFVNAKIETETEGDAGPRVVAKTDLDTKIEATEPDIKVEVKSEPSLTLKSDSDAPEIQLDVNIKIDPQVKEEPEVKSEAKGGPASPLIPSNELEPDPVVFGTFQPLEPEEIEDLVASFAPLLVTIVQLDPSATIVPPGLIDLSKSISYAHASDDQEVAVKSEPVEVGLHDDEPVTTPISFSLEGIVSPLARSSMFPQVQIVLEPSTTPAPPASGSPIPLPVTASPRRTRGLPRRTSPQLAALPPTCLRFASVSSISSASGSHSGSSACSSDSELGDSTPPLSSPIANRFRPLHPPRRTKASPPQLGPASPSQRKRKRGCEEEPSPYDPSKLSTGRPLKRARGVKRDPEEKEAHATLCAEFVPPPLPKVSMVSESRQAKRKRREEEEEELRVIKRARVLCHVNATHEESLERPCHSMAALVLHPALGPQPSSKLEKVSGLPVVISAPITLEEIEKKLRVAVEDGPHPIVEEIKNLSLEALALMTDLEFSALICSPESWELRCLEYEPNENLFEDPPTPHPEPTNVLLAPPSPPISTIVALPPAENITSAAPLEVEQPVEPTCTAPAEEIVVKQEPIELVLGLALAPMLPSAIETAPERTHDALSIAHSASDAREDNRCRTPSLTDGTLSTRPRSPKPTPTPLVRGTRTKRAVGMMDMLSLSGERVSPTLKDAFDLFKYEAEEADWKPARPYNNDGRRVPRSREFEGAWVPFMDYRQSVRYHPEEGG